MYRSSLYTEVLVLNRDFGTSRVDCIWHQKLVELLLNLIILPNQKIFSNSLWIAIALINFENAAFGKIDAIKGLSLKEYLHNVFNLTFYLYNGYDLTIH